MNRRQEGEPKYASTQIHGWERWTPTEVGRFFCSKGMRSVGDAFYDAHVTGRDLKELSYADLCDLGFRDEEIRRYDEIMQTYLLHSSL